MKQFAITGKYTLREYPSLEKYFSEIEKIGPVSVEEEVALTKKIRNGDQAALDRLTRANLRFVISVAKQYQNMGLTLGDLINEGNVGLMIAARRFDETKGFKFISYAIWWIRQSIIGALAEHGHTIRVPYNKLTLFTKVNKAFIALEQDLNRKPTSEELGEYLGLPAIKITELIRRSGKHSFLYGSFGNEDYSLLDVLQHDGGEPDEEIMYESVKTEINHSMRILTKRERDILILYFGLGELPPMTLKEICKQYNITKEHTGKIKDQALKKLRSCSRAQVLQSCLN